MPVSQPRQDILIGYDHGHISRIYNEPGCNGRRRNWHYTCHLGHPTRYQSAVAVAAGWLKPEIIARGSLGTEVRTGGSANDRRTIPFAPLIGLTLCTLNNACSLTWFSRSVSMLSTKLAMLSNGYARLIGSCHINSLGEKKLSAVSTRSGIGHVIVSRPEEATNCCIVKSAPFSICRLALARLLARPFYTPTLLSERLLHCQCFSGVARFMCSWISNNASLKVGSRYHFMVVLSQQLPVQTGRAPLSWWFDIRVGKTQSIHSKKKRP